MNYLDFDAYVDAHASQFIDRLVTLCRIPGVAAEGGRAIAQAADAVVDLPQAADRRSRRAGADR